MVGGRREVKEREGHPGEPPRSVENHKRSITLGYAQSVQGRPQSVTRGLENGLLARPVLKKRALPLLWRQPRERAPLLGGERRSD